MKRVRNNVLKVLTCILLIGLVVFLSFVLAKVKQKNLKDALSGTYPFVFAGGDSTYHVTQGFYLARKIGDISVSYNLPEGFALSKQDDFYAVSIPELDRNLDVTVVLSAASWYGKARIEYPIRVITGKTSDYSSYVPVDIEAVKEGSTRNAMEVCISDMGRGIQYLYGDFGDAVVNNGADALAFVSCYLPTIQFPCDVCLVGSIPSQDTTVYQFMGVTEAGVKIPGNTLELTVDAHTSMPRKISISCKDTYLSENNPKLAVPMEEYDENLTVCLATDRFVYWNVDTVMYHGEYYDILGVSLLDNGLTGYAAMSQKTKTMFAFNSGISSIMDPLLSKEQPQNGADGELQLREIPRYQSVTGVTEYGKEVRFDSSRTEDGYVLEDKRRGISIYRKSEEWSETGVRGLLRSDSVSKLGLQNGTYYPVLSESGTFGEEDAIEVTTLQYLGDIYDYYANVLGHRSFDGAGSEILVFTNIADSSAYGFIDTGNFTNNACFCQADGCFYIGRKGSAYAYSPIADPMVLAHEYSHGVQNAVCDSTGWKALFSDNSVPTSISEGYADSLGMLSCKGKDNWLVGENILKAGSFVWDTKVSEDTPVYMRDLKNIESEGLSHDIYGGDLFYYDDVKFSAMEGHTQGILLGNVCCQMAESGLFTREEIARIWYNSMYYGLNGSSTFVTVRRNILQAMDGLSYDTAHKDAVAVAFDSVHIYDDSYVLSGESQTQDRDKSHDSVYRSGIARKTGDPLYDDTEVCKFAVMYSMADLSLGSATLTIYECSDRDTGLTDQEMSALIEDLVNKDSRIKDRADASSEGVNGLFGLMGAYTGSDMPEVSPEHISVTYQRMSEKKMEKLEEMIDSNQGFMSDFLGGILEDTGADLVDSGILNGMFEEAVTAYVTQETAYSFFTGL